MFFSNLLFLVENRSIYEISVVPASPHGNSNEPENVRKYRGTLLYCLIIYKRCHYRGNRI